MHAAAATLTALLSASYALAGPAPVPHNGLLRRDNCTFTGATGYLDVLKAKNSCSTITLSSLQVPGNVTLNLEKLNAGTTVIFEGTTTWGFAEWSGSLFSVSGDSITVKGAPGSVLDGQGAFWWDGLGNGGGKTKPKFFKANNREYLPGFLCLRLLETSKRKLRRIRTRGKRRSAESYERTY